MRLSRIGDPGALSVRIGTTPGAADVGTGRLDGDRVHPVWDLWYEADTGGPPLELKAGRAYQLTIERRAGGRARRRAHRLRSSTARRVARTGRLRDRLSRARCRRATRGGADARIRPSPARRTTAPPPRVDARRRHPWTRGTRRSTGRGASSLADRRAPSVETAIATLRDGLSQLFALDLGRPRSATGAVGDPARAGAPGRRGAPRTLRRDSHRARERRRHRHRGPGSAWPPAGRPAAARRSPRPRRSARSPPASIDTSPKFARRITTPGAARRRALFGGLPSADLHGWPAAATRSGRLQRGLGLGESRGDRSRLGGLPRAR